MGPTPPLPLSSVELGFTGGSSGLELPLVLALALGSVPTLSVSSAPQALAAMPNARINPENHACFDGLIAFRPCSIWCSRRHGTHLATPFWSRQFAKPGTFLLTTLEI